MSHALGIVHGYGFSGAGSNLWTRSIVRALCHLGHTVHVVCQESRPEHYDFVASAVKYDADGEPETLFERETPVPGRCVVHRPDLAVLPTYVRPRTNSTYVRSILDLDDAAIEEYVERNARVLTQVAEHVTGFCVNHVVLSSLAVQRAKERTGVPFAVLPHGSAIEYIVKKDERMHAAASAALAAADRVFALNGEMEGRFRDVFSNVPGLDAKVGRLPVGVDTDQFDVAPRDERDERIEALLGFVADEKRGRTAAQQQALRDALRDDLADADLRTALDASADYVSSAPDADLETKLRAVDWDDAAVVLYVGRLITEKGFPAVVVAFSEILARRPDARLVVAGTGGLRDAMEAFVWAASQGYRRLARRIVELGTALQGEAEPEPLPLAAPYFDRLEAAGELDAYFDRAERHLRPEHVVFTGFLDHAPLGKLYAVADVGVFPSVVREASPLVIPEAAASGTLPVGTDYGGMGDSLRILGEALPAEARALLTVRHDAEHTVADIIDRVSDALAEPGRYAADLREAAVARYDWRAIADDLADTLAALPTAAVR
ncbi:MAG: glycosyltransferase family 4 protein [Rhodothermales bacterium]